MCLAGYNKPLPECSYARCNYLCTVAAIGARCGNGGMAHGLPLAIAMFVSLWRQTTALAQLAGFIVTGFTIGMAPCSAELTRGALGFLLQRDSK